MRTPRLQIFTNRKSVKEYRRKGSLSTVFCEAEMSHNVTLIGSVWLLATIITWLVCRWRGYTVAAWAAPLTISAFCLGLFISAENTSKGRFRVPFLTHLMHRQHLVAHWR